MRQTPMDRWIEAAEANRFCLIAQQRRDQPTDQTPLAPLLTRLRSMVQPEVFHQRRVHPAVTRSTVSA
jgi:hypothetical protein